MSRSDEQVSIPYSSSITDRLAFLPASLQQFRSGNVSRSTLLTKLLPLSLVSLLSTLAIAARHFPHQYDWRTRVISQLISPRYNPEGYWLPSIGMAIAAVLALPFAGYVEQRLHAIAPRMSRWSGLALGIGIFLVISVTLPLNVPSLPPAIRCLHEGLARTTGVAIISGMVLCCLSGLKDRFSRFGGQQSLSPILVANWAVITLLPIICGVFAGVLRLGRIAKFEWATELRQHLKETMLWQLAFWEWVGVAAFILFMLVSVMLLPERGKAAGDWQP